jgi:hypothetical protein
MISSSIVALAVLSAAAQVHVTEVYVEHSNHRPATRARVFLKRLEPDPAGRPVQLTEDPHRPGWYTTTRIAADTTCVLWGVIAPSVDDGWPDVKEAQKVQYPRAAPIRISIDINGIAEATYPTDYSLALDDCFLERMECQSLMIRSCSNAPGSPYGQSGPACSRANVQPQPAQGIQGSWTAKRPMGIAHANESVRIIGRPLFTLKCPLRLNLESLPARLNTSKAADSLDLLVMRHTPAEFSSPPRVRIPFSEQAVKTGTANSVAGGAVRGLFPMPSLPSAPTRTTP